jgi:Fic family protein
MLVKEEFTKTDGKGQGNFKLEKIKFLIDYFEEKKTFTSTLPQLEVSYPTMQKYLTKLESYGFIKKVGKSYRMV